MLQLIDRRLPTIDRYGKRRLGLPGKKTTAAIPLLPEEPNTLLIIKQRLLPAIREASAKVGFV